MPSDVYVYDSPGEMTAPKFARAFARGCGGHIVTSYHPGTWAGFGSPRTFDMMRRAIAEGHTWYFGDKAYFGRGDYFRVTRNAYQHTGISDKPSQMRRLRRWHTHAEPWRKDGRYIILATHSETYYGLHGTTSNRWINETVRRIREVSDREIIITSKNANPAHLHYSGAWCLVTMRSNAAVEAVMRGIPVFCTHDCAASAMGLSDLAKIEQPLYPDGRMEWAGVLADNQWTLYEIDNGDAWRALNG